jgi:hypothetical protein
MMSMVRRTAAWLGSVIALLSFAASTASAETLLMPKRDYLMGTSEVVWGVTTQANGTAFTLDYGDGSADTVGVVVDRSYIAFNHTYATSGTFTVTLTVGAEVATVDVNVYNGALLSAFDLRGLNINRAIQDGLRFLWTNQASRAANFPSVTTTNWGGFYSQSHAALVVAAFQNHGYRLTNDDVAPTGVYEKYVVRRGLNFIISGLTAVTLTVEAAGSPCVGPGIEAAPCVGYEINQGRSHSSYETPLALVALAGSGAYDRTNSEVAGITNGKKYREIAQRVSNAVVWGQNESGNGRGGWGYVLDNQANSDGSTVGWVVLGLLDAEAAGTILPAFVKTEFAMVLNTSHNTNGSLDYQSDGNPAALNSVGLEKGGIPLQILHFTDTDAPFPPGSKGAATVQYISDRWKSGRLAGDAGWFCNVLLEGVTQHNFGCAYSMFNIFKGLKLQGITTIDGSTRPAGPGPIPADDWYADYQDWLVANQTSPTTLAGGNWGTMRFSCCDDSAALNSAIAELILAPVALVLPDPGDFASVGLAPLTATNPPGTSHTVTATARSITKTPVPGVTIDFRVMSGPNAGKTGTDITDANGEATFTYPDTSLPPHGTDIIQAFIGTFASNTVEKHWVLAVVPCDIDGDKDVDLDDIGLIRAANGTRVPAGSTDPRDANGDRRINNADARYCTLKCTRPGCAK